MLLRLFESSFDWWSESCVPVYDMTGWQTSVELQSVACLHAYQHSTERQNWLNDEIIKEYVICVIKFHPNFLNYFMFYFTTKFWISISVKWPCFHYSQYIRLKIFLFLLGYFEMWRARLVEWRTKTCDELLKLLNIFKNILQIVIDILVLYKNVERISSQSARPWVRNPLQIEIMLSGPVKLWSDTCTSKGSLFTKVLRKLSPAISSSFS